MKRPQEHEYTSHVAYSRALEAYCNLLEQPAQDEPVAMRYDFDGYGWKYIDSGSGSDWQTRIKGAEPVYDRPQAREPEQPAIPQGWKLVPVKPTRQMLEAGAEDLRLRGLPLGLLVGAEECYRHMLNAAPTPQGE